MIYALAIGVLFIWLASFIPGPRERGIKEIQAKKHAINEATDVEVAEALTNRARIRLTGIFIKGRLHKIIMQRRVPLALEDAVFYYDYERRKRRLMFVEKVYSHPVSRRVLYVYRCWQNDEYKHLHHEAEGDRHVMPFTDKTDIKIAREYAKVLEDAYENTRYI